MISQLDQQLTVYAFIFARGGSKGIPNKNLRLLAGKPLIAHAIETALSTPCIDRVIVSTDSADISKTAIQYGAEVPFLRPAHLADDHSNEWQAWQHALEYMKEESSFPDIFLSVPATAPLRLQEDLEACVSKLSEGGFDLVITATPSTHHPSYNMIVLNENGEASIAVQQHTIFTRRQDVNQMYDMTTVGYAAKSSFIMENKRLFEGRVGAVILPRERAIDIDCEMDFKIADLLMKERLELSN